MRARSCQSCCKAVGASSTTGGLTWTSECGCQCMIQHSYASGAPEAHICYIWRISTHCQHPCLHRCLHHCQHHCQHHCLHHCQHHWLLAQPSSGACQRVEAACCTCCLDRPKITIACQRTPLPAHLASTSPPPAPPLHPPCTPHPSDPSICPHHHHAPPRTHTLNLNSSTSPSATTYSLPSNRSVPASLHPGYPLYLT